MANPKRGEASFTVDAGENRGEYTLRFSLNVLCTLEEDLGRGLPALVEEWGGGQVALSDLRQVFRGALAAGGHKGLSLEDVGDLMEDAGLENILGTLMEAFNRSALAVSDEEAEDQEDPPMETDGTGTSS